jgi:hypothetical protein
MIWMDKLMPCFDYVFNKNKTPGIYQLADLNGVAE